MEAIRLNKQIAAEIPIKMAKAPSCRAEMLFETQVAVLAAVIYHGVAEPCGQQLDESFCMPNWDWDD